MGLSAKPEPGCQNGLSMASFGVKNTTKRLGSSCASAAGMRLRKGRPRRPAPRPPRRVRRLMVRVLIVNSSFPCSAMAEAVARRDGYQELADVEARSGEVAVRVLDGASVLVGVGAPRGVPEPLLREALLDLVDARELLGELDRACEGAHDLVALHFACVRDGVAAVVGVAVAADGVVAIETVADGVHLQMAALAV